MSLPSCKCLSHRAFGLGRQTQLKNYWPLTTGPVRGPTPDVKASRVIAGDRAIEKKPIKVSCIKRKGCGHATVKLEYDPFIASGSMRHAGNQAPAERKQ